MTRSSASLDLEAIFFKIKIEAEQTFLRGEALRRVPGRGAPDPALLRAWIGTQNDVIVDVILHHPLGLGNPFHAAHLALVDAAVDAHAAGAFDPAPPGNG